MPTFFFSFPLILNYAKVSEALCWSLCRFIKAYKDYRFIGLDLDIILYIFLLYSFGPWVTFTHDKYQHFLS